jgi:hypothetical protein
MISPGVRITARSGRNVTGDAAGSTTGEDRIPK